MDEKYKARDDILKEIRDIENSSKRRIEEAINLGDIRITELQEKLQKEYQDKKSAIKDSMKEKYDQSILSAEKSLIKEIEDLNIKKEQIKLNASNNYEELKQFFLEKMME